MNRCKDCKYWTRVEVYSTPETTKFGECKNKKFFYGGFPHSDTGYPYPDSDGVFYADGEGHSAWLHMGEDFGCVHFEEVER